MKSFRSIVPLVILFAFLVAGLLAQNRSNSREQISLPVGVAGIEITPQRPIRLSGYGSRLVPHEGVDQKLFARAMAIGADDSLSLLITMDAIGVPGWLSQELSERLQTAVSLPRENLVVAATHTHAAPALKGNIPFMFIKGATDAEWREIDTYTDDLLDKLETIARQAIANRKLRTIDFATGKLTFAANRRVLKDGKWAGFGVQEDGPVDHRLPVMRVSNPDGSVAAIFTSYACHCTTLGGKYNRIHGDWAGVARERIEKRYPGSTALIAIGCGADQNPNPRGELENAVAHGVAMADEIDRLLENTEFRPVRSTPVAVYREIDLPLDPPPSRQELERLAVEDRMGGHLQRSLLAQLDRGEQIADSVAMPVQTWKFGEELAMIFLGGEVVVDYALRFYQEYDADRIWVNAYCNDVPCYIPSRRMYEEGGYEVDRSMTYYGQPARLGIETEERVAGEVQKQMGQTFRKEK